MARDRVWGAAVAALVAGLFLWHWAVIWRTGVDVPFMDEWEVLRTEGLPSGLTWNWLVSQQNEHRLVLTRLQIWALFHLDGWNLRRHQALNFGIYGLLAWAVYSFARMSAPSPPGWVLGAFLPFILSPTARESHTYGIQSDFHFQLLLHLATCWLWFRRRDLASAALGGLCAVLGIFCLASGLSCAAAALGLLFARVLGGPRSQGQGQRLAAAAGIVALGAAAWLRGHVMPSYHPPLVGPHRGLFWDFWLNLLSAGFGFERLSAPAGLACLAVLVVPMRIAYSRERRGDEWWCLAAAGGGILAVLAAIAMARAPFGLEYAKSSRYTEYSSLLIPLGAAGWALAWAKRRGLAAALAGLWLCCGAAFQDNWRFSAYERIARGRRLGVECLRRHWRGEGPDYCPTLHPEPLGERLRNARAINVSFARGSGVPPP